MYRIEVDKRINQTISFTYSIGFWGDAKRTTFRKWCLKAFHMAVVIYYLIVVTAGAFISDTDTETICLVFLSLAMLIHTVRVFYCIRQENTIVMLVRSIGTHSIKDREMFSKVNNKIGNFIRFASIYYFSVVIGVVAIIFSTIISKRRRLPFNVYSPFDWQNNEFAYVMAVISTMSAIGIISVQVLLCATCIWYVMMCCGIDYQILENEFKNIGKSTLKKQISVVKERDLFLKDLIVLIQKHQKLQETTKKLNSCFSNVFFIQIVTSGLSICGSVYNLAFNSSKDPFTFLIYVVLLVHSVFDIFMETYFGNEIVVASSRLSYALFESDWMDQSNLSKRSMIILMEALKRPQKLIVGKIYPLNLEIFTKILNAAYSMFNILKSLKYK